MTRGFVTCLPVASFVNRDYKLSREEKTQRMESRYDDSGDFVDGRDWSWIPVSDALKRGGRIVIEGQSPAHKIFISFTEQKEGSYELKGAVPKNFIECGSVQAVTPIQPDEDDVRFQKIMTCPVRYVVITTTPYPHRRKAWVIGLTELREVTEDV